MLIAKKIAPKSCMQRLLSLCHKIVQRLAFTHCHMLYYTPCFWFTNKVQSAAAVSSSHFFGEQIMIYLMLKYLMWLVDILVTAKVLNLPRIHSNKIIWYENLWYYKLYLTFQGSFESAQLTELLKHTKQHILQRGKTYRCVS